MSQCAIFLGNDKSLVEATLFISVKKNQISENDRYEGV